MKATPPYSLPEPELDYTRPQRDSGDFTATATTVLVDRRSIWVPGKQSAVRVSVGKERIQWLPVAIGK